MLSCAAKALQHDADLCPPLKNAAVSRGGCHFTTFAADSFTGPDFCLIFAP